MTKHRYSSSSKRAFISIIIISIIMVVGTVGVHLIEKMAYIDAFYLMSMIATGQGPLYTPQSVLGKIFISLMSFVSIGAGVASIGFLFGPFFGQLWHLGRLKIDEENKEKNAKIH